MNAPAGAILAVAERDGPHIFVYLAAGLVMVYIGVGVFMCSRYRRCPSNRILVIYGKTGKGAAKCVHGGMAFIWPMLQAWDYLSLEPMLVPLELNGAISADGTRLWIVGTLTAAISTREDLMQKAASRLLGLRAGQIVPLVQDAGLTALQRATRQMSDGQLAVGHVELADALRNAAAGPLAEMGIEIVNANVRDIRTAAA